MTNPLPPEAHALVILGEVRGDLKGLLRSHLDLQETLRRNEEQQNEQNSRLSARVATLEAFKLKIGVFAIALSTSLSLTIDKVPALIRLIIGGTP